MQEAAQENTTQGDQSIVDRGKGTAVRGYRGAERRVRRSPRKYAIWVGSILLLLMGIFVPSLRAPKPHVALSGEPIFVGGWLTNSVLTTIVVDIVIIVLALLATRGMKSVPGRWQNFIEMMLEYLYGLSEGVAGREARRYFPWVVTIFIFIIVSNWIGLIPGVGSIVVHQAVPAEEHALTYDRQIAISDGGLMFAGPTAEGGEGEEENGEGHGKEVPLFRAPTADLNTTFALALITMIMVQVWGIRALGIGYFRKYFTFKGPNLGMKFISAFVGILELTSEFSRLLAFGFRLFGNIFAGEIVLATMAFLITYWLPAPFYILEVFIGFVQALVFMMLALVFFSMATMSHEHDH